MKYGDPRSVRYPSNKYEGVFHCREAGDEDTPPMVLLHGHMAHAIAYRRVWHRLSKGFRVIAPDLPGHGFDETFHGLQMQPRVDTLAHWLFDLLDELDDGPVHLVGHSLGASIAYEAGLLEPARFRSLTLVSPAFCLSAPPGAATFFELMPAGLARVAMTPLGMRLIEPFRWQGEPLGAEEAAAYVEPLQDVERLEFTLRLGAALVRAACGVDQLEPPEVPTCLLFGRGDDFVTVDDADAIADRLGAARMQVFSRAGHSPAEDTPVEFVDAVLEFIDAL